MATNSSSVFSLNTNGHPMPDATVYESIKFAFGSPSKWQFLLIAILLAATYDQSMLSDMMRLFTVPAADPP
jgi:hypothetical protein